MNQAHQSKLVGIKKGCPSRLSGKIFILESDCLRQTDSLTKKLCGTVNTNNQQELGALKPLPYICPFPNSTVLAESLQWNDCVGANV